MGDGVRGEMSPEVMGSLSDRVTESISDAVSGTVESAKSGADSMLDMAITRGEPSLTIHQNDFIGNDVTDTYRESVFTELSHSDPVSPGTPVIVEENGETMTAIAGTHETSGSMTVITSDSEVIEVTPGSEKRVTHAADPEKMNTEEYNRFQKDRFLSGTRILGDVTEAGPQQTLSGLQEGMDRIQDSEVLDSFVSNVKAVTFEDGLGDGDKFGAFTGEVPVSGSTVMGFNSTNLETTFHEFGHSVAVANGYNHSTSFQRKVSPTKKSIHQVARNNAREIPDFGGEVRFGENTAEFNEFLLTHKSGSIAGGAEANMERAVANANRDELVVRDAGDMYDSQVDAFEDVSHGDMVMIEGKNGEQRVGVITRKVTNSGDMHPSGEKHQQIVVQAGFDSETDEPTDTGLMTGIRYFPGEGNNGEVTREIDGVVDKEATAEQLGVDVESLKEQSTCPDSVSEELHNMLGEVNKTWARTAAHKEAGRDTMAQHMQIGDEYSTTNPQETLASVVSSSLVGTKVRSGGEQVDQLHEDSPVRKNRELTEAVDDVFELPDIVTERMDGEYYTD